MKTVVVLGGYGNFGQRIVESLCCCTDTANDDLRIVIAGRNINRADALISQMQSNANIKITARLLSAQLDINSRHFADNLRALKPDIVIHTSGPYQGQLADVAKACVALGAHYIDLADDIGFVNGVCGLDTQAREQQVLLISGASSVPGLSAAVIDYYRHHFNTINFIDIAIAPGNKAQRGEATVKGILSYTGHSFDAFINGGWQKRFGWLEARKHRFGLGLGERWLANVDVPDLTLFPERYQVKDTVRFQAGLELPLLHLTMVLMAKMTKSKIVSNWAGLSKPIFQLSRLFSMFGTDNGGMEVIVKGRDHGGMTNRLRWTLFAPNGVGPYIPTLSAIIAAKKLIAGQLKQTGAKACIDVFALADFYPYFKQYDIRYEDEYQVYSANKEN